MRLSMKCLYDEVNPGLCHVKINQSYVPCPPATTRLSYHPSFVQNNLWVIGFTRKSGLIHLKTIPLAV